MIIIFKDLLLIEISLQRNVRVYTMTFHTRRRNDQRPSLMLTKLVFTDVRYHADLRSDANTMLM